jgi:hypothetical protein
VRTLQIVDSLLFVAADWEGLFIYDVSDPDTMKPVGHYDRTVLSFVIEDDLIYAASRFIGLNVLDWSDVSEIKEVSTYNTYGSCEDIAVSGDTVIIADGFNGILLLKKNVKLAISTENILHNPELFVLQQNYPNPFNPFTNISYELPLYTEVSLTVHNITGQNVATLVSERQQPGVYRYRWDAADFPSGVYFARFETGDIQHVKKMILVR